MKFETDLSLKHIQGRQGEDLTRTLICTEEEKTIKQFCSKSDFGDKYKIQVLLSFSVGVRCFVFRFLYEDDFDDDVDGAALKI